MYIWGVLYIYGIYVIIYKYKYIYIYIYLYIYIYIYFSADPADGKGERVREERLWTTRNRSFGRQQQEKKVAKIIIFYRFQKLDSRTAEVKLAPAAAAAATQQQEQQAQQPPVAAAWQTRRSQIGFLIGFQKGRSGLREPVIANDFAPLSARS